MNNKTIKGSKSSGRTYIPVEDPNSLQSATIARIVDLLGEGEVEGLVDGDKSVYLNEVQLQDDGGSYNYSGVTVEERKGTSTQTYIPGISDVAGNIVNVSAEIVHATPVVRSITDTEVDDIRVVIAIPSLYEAELDGDIRKTSVQLKIEVKPNAGGYQIAKSDIIIDGKCTSTYQKAIRIKDLSNYGAGPWDIKVTRDSPDSGSARLVNKTYWDNIVEIKERKIQYRDSAIIGLEFDAREFGNNAPKRAYDVEGLKILVPDNRYWNQFADVVTYSGTWGGSFKAAEFCDNPAWVLYDILTTDRYGFGLDGIYVDKWGLYNLGVYCDTKIDDGFGDQERRFTFNGVIQSRAEAFHIINMIASNMRATPFWTTGLASFTQDCPKDATRLVSAANVEGGLFNYSSTALKERYTVVYVTWNDPDDFYKQTIELVEDHDGISRYGHKPLNVIAYGCTSRGQAHRYGKWILESQLEETERIEYTAGFDHIDCQIGEIVEVADPHKSAVNRFGGRIVSSTSTSITIDNAVDLASGQTYSVEMITSDGVVSKDLTNSVPSSNVTVLTWTGSVSPLPDDNAMWLLIASDLAPMPYRVIGVEEIEKHKYKITGTYYDSGKFARIEDGIHLPSAPYTNIPEDELTPPTNIDVQPYTYTDGGDDNHHYGSLVSWEQSVDARTSYYQVESKDGTYSWIREGDTSDNSYVVTDVSPGTWSYRVRGVSLTRKSIWLTYSDYNIPTISGIMPPDWIQVRGGGTTWSGTDCEVEWAECSGSDYYGENITNTLKDYQLKIYRSSDDELLRTETTSDTTYNYTYYFNTDDNIRVDGSVPQRGLKFSVWSRDIYDTLSATYTTGTFTNPAPDMVGAPTVLAIFQGVKIDWHNIAPTDNDGKKYIVCVGTNTPPTTQVAEVGWNTNRWTEMGLDTDSLYYAQIEPFDDFGAGNKSSVSDAFEPLKVGEIDIDAELTSSIIMTDSETTATGTLETLYDRTVDSGGVTYNAAGSEMWVNYDYGLEDYIDRVRVYTSVATKVYFAYKRLDGDWNYLKAEADHTLNTEDELLAASSKTNAATNYWLTDAGKTVAIFPQNIIMTDCRMYIYDCNATIYELVFNREVVAEQVTADNLSAFSADLGVVAAGTLQSSNLSASEGMFFDMTGDEIKLGGTSSPKFHWDGGAGTLAITAAVTFQSATTGYTNINDKPTDLGDINATEGGKLTGIQTGADVTGSHTANNASNYTGNTINTAYTSAKCTDVNADQTSANTASNTSNVGSVPATVVQGWRYGATTYINGGDIYTNTITANQIAAITITANEIAANTITAGQMAANSINTSELIASSVTATIVGTNEIIANAANIKNAVITGAKIGNAEVNTLQLAGQSVTIPVSAYTSAEGSQVSGNYNSIYTMQSASITSSGAPIAVSTSLRFKCVSMNPMIRIYRGSTLLYEYLNEISSVYWISTIAISDTPGSGSHTYYLQVTYIPAGTTVYYKNRSIVLLETKR